MAGCLAGLVNYSTVKTIRFQSHTRLRNFYLAICCCLLVYTVVYKVLFKYQYCDTETPQAAFNAWPITAPPPSIIPSYCLNASKYDWGEHHTAEERQATGGFQSVFATTNFSLSAAQCMPYNYYQHFFVRATEVSVVTCVLDAQGGLRFLMGADDVAMNMIHVVSSGLTGDSLPNIRTLVYSHDGSVFLSLPAGAMLTDLSVGSLLRLAGVQGGLEAENHQPWISSEQPRYRLTGAVLLVRMRYTNVRPFSLYNDPLCEVRVELMPSQWGFLGGTTAVRIMFVAEGVWGVWDSTHTVFLFIELFFLLSVAKVVVDFVAERWSYLGVRCVFAHKKFDDVYDEGTERERENREDERSKREVNRERQNTERQDSTNLERDTDKADTAQDTSRTGSTAALVVSVSSVGQL